MVECPVAVAAEVEAGWAAYRADRLAEAGAHFRGAHARCPAHIGARLGLGYVALREGRADEARRFFEDVLRAEPLEVDALVGLGLLAWRAGDLAAVRSYFVRVRELDPARPEAREYLSRLPDGLGPPPARAPLVLPDTLVYPARARAGRFEVRTARGWQPFYVKGVNLGAALPGRHPSEFPDSATYAGWIREIAELGANTIRVYTIHPPHFYQALYAHNRAHPDRPLWLLHGAWVELPPDDDYDDPVWEGEFFAEMRRVVDLLHGRADLEPRPGHASGHYTADVSPWVLGYIIGREWEPYSVLGYLERRPDASGWRGRYLEVRGGNAMDAWLARACEAIVAYETETYRAQRPVAYTNWPTLDPLHHPTEATSAEEVAIRRWLGEAAERSFPEHDEDAVAVDASLVRPTDALPAGYFAAYHAYPYYPPFMNLDARYRAARSPYGPSTYYGYLRRLQEHHGDVPVLVAEYGVPASLTASYLHVQGWHHGGHDEDSMARINARLTREIAAAGMAGGVVFAWIDEWFKRNWLVADFEIPAERNPLWLNRLDPEQHYGLIAMEPASGPAGASLRERRAAWSAVPPLYGAADGVRLRAAADEAYLWLHLKYGVGPLPEAMIGFDIVRPDAGSFRWPGSTGERLPVGVEFVLQIRPDTVRLLADPASNPFRVYALEAGRPARLPVQLLDFENPPAGSFRGRVFRQPNAPFRTVPREDGEFEPLLVVANDRRFGRDTTEYAAVGYDRGILRPGPPPDGSWEIDRQRGAVEVRIPWALLNFTDPSQRRILQDPPADGQDSPDAAASRLAERFATQTVEAVGIVMALRDRSGAWRSWPASGRAEDVARFSWPTWDEPRWRARRRPSFDLLRETFRTLQPPVLTIEEIR